MSVSYTSVQTQVLDFSSEPQRHADSTICGKGTICHLHNSSVLSDYLHCQRSPEKAYLIQAKFYATCYFASLPPICDIFNDERKTYS